MVWRGVFVVLLLVPGTLAMSVQFVDDAGDVRMTTSDGRFRNGAGASEWDNLDILSGGVYAETDDALTFFLNVTALEPAQDPPLPKSQPTYFFHFYYGDRGYRVVGTTDLTTPFDGVAGAPQKAAQLQMEYDEDVYHTIADAELELDFDNDQVRFTVERAWIRDHNEAPLGRGELLSQFWGYSRSLGWFGIPVLIGENFRVEVGPPAYSDEAPDFGSKGGAYKTVAGERLHKGLLVAASEDPVRWTNGEATTFVYYVRLFNQGSTALDVELGHEGVDPSWQVAFSDRLQVPANSAINVTFHVGIPFGHFHGKLHEFMVTFQTDDGSHWAKQPLAVYWPVIPQPAGHHPQVWFHSRYEPRETPFETLGDRVHGWVSAADPKTETFDEQLPINAERIDGPREDGTSTAIWTLRLEPALRMGLDFLLDEKGQGEVGMYLPVSVSDPTLSLEIVHLDRRTIIPKETLAIQAQSSLAGSQEGSVTFPFPELSAEQEADLIRHASRADLEFRFRLDAVLTGHGFENPEEFTPTMLPTSTLTLPLQEYHDPLDTVFVTDASVEVTVGPEGQEKKVNVGEQVVFTFELAYRGTFTSGFDVELSGLNHEWARVLGDAHFEIEPGGTREVAIAVQPPQGARMGDFADVTIKVIGSVNAAVQAGIVVRAEVVSDDVADEAEIALQKAKLLESPKDSKAVIWPWFVFPPLVIAAGVGVLWRLRPDLLFFWR